MKCKKYGARILEVVAQIVGENQSACREVGLDNAGSLSSPGEGSTSSKRRREGERGVGKAPGRVVHLKWEQIMMMSRMNSDRQDNPLLSSKKVKQTAKGDILCLKDKC